MPKDEFSHEQSDMFYHEHEKEFTERRYYIVFFYS